MGVVGAAAYEPKDSVVGIDKEQLLAFFRRSEFVVGEIVAQKLRPMCHAEGLKTVAPLPMAQTDWEGERVGIEDGSVGGQMLGIESG